MMTPLQALEAIAALLERGMASADPLDRYSAMVGAHTHAIIQASSLRKREAYAERVAADIRGEAVH
ncbi:hypothetical protein [Phenylobacterium koreense]|uniref:Uncharacterized protein n=1 Tax=Phenylobacterium koreense TaxID=266125 RepID=A0ABV2EJN3_9CAUL